MAKPRGMDWLDDEISNLKNQDVGVSVSLLEPNEIFELGLSQEQQLCSRYNITYINFPIADRAVPKDKEKTESLINQLWREINRGISVVIHCRMGIGRSSLIAGCVLLKTGHHAHDIFEHISTVRGLKVPDTDEQIVWLKNSYQKKI